MIKQEIEEELETTYSRAIALIESISEADYPLPTNNPAWTVGDILFHITLGPQALAFEAWMITHMRGLFQFGMRHFPSRLFNRVNASFGQQGNRVSRQGLIKAYGKAHAVIRSRLRRTQEEDFAKSVVYPADFVSELEGEVTVERIFRYVTEHFELHERQLAVPRN